MKLACSVPRVVVGLVIGLVLMASTAATASGQVLYGSVVGTLSDATGAVVPGATVVVTNQDTGLTRQVVTDQNGYYSIPNLLEGVYDLAVTSGGFKPYTQKGVTISINRVTRVDAALDVGAVTESGQRGSHQRGPADEQGGCQHDVWTRERWRTCRCPGTATISR